MHIAQPVNDRQLTIRKQFAEYTWSSHQYVNNIFWHITQQPLNNHPENTVTVNTMLYGDTHHYDLPKQTRNRLVRPVQCTDLLNSQNHLF